MSDRAKAAAPVPAQGHRVLRLLALIAVIAGVLVLDAAACALSYSGIHAIARQAGVSPSLARIYPGIFDAMLVIASAAVLSLRGAGVLSRAFAWLSLLVLLAAAGGADVLHAIGTKLPHRPTVATVAAVPWALVLIGFGLLLTMLRHARRRGQAAQLEAARLDAARQELARLEATRLAVTRQQAAEDDVVMLTSRPAPSLPQPKAPESLSAKTPGKLAAQRRDQLGPATTPSPSSSSPSSSSPTPATPAPDSGSAVQSPPAQPPSAAARPPAPASPGSAAARPAAPSPAGPPSSGPSPASAAPADAVPGQSPAGTVPAPSAPLDAQTSPAAPPTDPARTRAGSVPPQANWTEPSGGAAVADGAASGGAASAGEAERGSAARSRPESSPPGSTPMPVPAQRQDSQPVTPRPPASHAADDDLVIDTDPGQDDPTSDEAHQPAKSGTGTKTGPGAETMADAGPRDRAVGAVGAGTGSPAVTMYPAPTLADVTPPAQDTVAQSTTPRDTAPKDTTSKDTAPEDPAPKVSARDTAPAATTSSKPEPRASAPRDGAEAPGDTHQDSAHQNLAHQDSAPQDPAPQGPARQTSARQDVAPVAKTSADGASTTTTSPDSEGGSPAQDGAAREGDDGTGEDEPTGQGGHLPLFRRLLSRPIPPDPGE
jgi:hypothetical protein